MRHPPVSMRVPTRVLDSGPLTAATVGRVLMTRNPAAVQRLGAAITAHRAHLQADAELVRQAGQP